ncbi:MAG: hypothetical protein Q9164_005323 [Protoblastenia rupestris]
MPTYTILGATGKTGGSILSLLLQSPANKINLYVRSTRKLLSQNPSLSTNKNITIYQGAVTDIPLIQSCLSPSVDAVFVTLGVNENTPGIRVNQDAAQAIVAALTQIRFADSSAKIPKIVLLSSCSLNEEMSHQDPKFLHWMLLKAFSTPYGDLALAQKFLELHRSWLDVTYMQPAGLVEDAQKGHTLSLNKHADGFVSYLDVAAGMIEVAQTGGYVWEGVSPLPKSKDVKIEWKAPPQMARGLVWHFMPLMGHAMKKIGVF